MKARVMRATVFAAAVLLILVSRPSPFLASANPSSLINKFSSIGTVSSTVPANGDVNPYGVAVVRRSIGTLVRGDILVSNFNNSANQQGTGTTIMEISPDGTPKVFAQIDPGLSTVCPGGIGLTTALVVLRTGWVIVGSLPTSDGTSTTARAGCLLVLNSSGDVVETIHGDLINGPWDMTALEGDGWAVLFVTNVLNGTVAANGATVNMGSVIRVRLSVDEDEMPSVDSETEIGSGFSERTDPAALVIGPTGVGFAHDGTLYVADTLNNRIAAIPRALSREASAGTGHTVSSGGALNAPLGLALAPNGNVIVVNSNDGNMVEITPSGNQIAVKLVDDTGIGAGTLFGLAVAPAHGGVYFVNDGDNTLRLLH